MLVAQAKFAVEYFLQKQIHDDRIMDIYQDIKMNLSNLVLIGMPSCGKSVFGKKLATQLNRTFVDMDEVIVQRSNRSIEELFAQKGEAYFRQMETELTAEFAKNNALVISTGGGVIKNSMNIRNLQQNGVLIFIDRPIESLLIGNGRPLSKSSEQVKQLYQERYQTYLDCSDFRILNDSSFDDGFAQLEQLVKK